MDVESIESSTPSLKRFSPHDDAANTKPLNLKGTQFMIPTPPYAQDSSNPSPDYNMADFTRELSPAASSSALSSIQDVSSIGGATQAVTSTERPAKRRKLTPAEKAEREKAKEAAAEEKAAQKRKKDEEKAVKDEEKRVLAEEKEMKKKKREVEMAAKKQEQDLKKQEQQAKKREKELAEERKAEEKLKKERSQMRLGAFFGASTTISVEDKLNKASTPEQDTTRRRSMSLETFDAIRERIGTTPKTIQQPRLKSEITEPAAEASHVNDYDKHFLPFVLKPHVSLATSSLPAPLDNNSQARFDAEIHSQSLREQYDLGLSSTYASITDHFSAQPRRGLPTIRTRAIVDLIDQSTRQTVDLSREINPRDPIQQLQRIPLRYLFFDKDVRPAYHGTYTGVASARSIRRLACNPFARERKDTDYDYDSEAEWDEPEGEDVDDDEDDEEELADEDEMDGWLENDDDGKGRRVTIDNLKVHNSGMCWADCHNRMAIPTEPSLQQAMQDLHFQFLLPGFKGTSIDPFSEAYWQDANATVPQTADAAPLPTRPPLQERSSNTGTAKPDNGWPVGDKPEKPAAKKGMKPGAQKTMSAQEATLFKDAVVGSVLSKQDLLAQLREKFPNFTAALVKGTLDEKYALVGKAKAKKWASVVAA